MEMFETNSITYAANPGRNWSREEQELNSYLAREWQYEPRGTRSTRAFCTGTECSTRGRRERSVAALRVRSHAWHVVDILYAVLIALHLRKAGQGREIG